MAFVGGGMETSGQELFYCRVCDEVTASNGGRYPWLLEPGETDGLCAKCGKTAQHWPAEEEEGLDLMTCPRCLYRSVKTESMGIWD